MPYLQNKTTHRYRLPELNRVVPGGGIIEITDAQAKRFEDHPLFEVVSTPPPADTDTDEPDDDTPPENEGAD